MRKLIASAAAAVVIGMGVMAPATASASENCNTVNWGKNVGFGKATGWACGNHAHGWVTDLAADGYCPYVITHWTSGGVASGPWVGPKGAEKEFDSYDPNGWGDFQYMEIAGVPC
ncbi:hypothetical protein ACGF8B_37220 [Streptomyces sp. NPDC047917]|uniref:hypothetical protein n=1 Tax=Streptomyces sp. NPDC047917 TaxID=3365491 RepID=UPI00371F826C